MLAFTALLFLALCASALVLALEAGTGRLVGRTPRSTRVRAGIFFAASVAGGALLVALSAQEWLLILALAPITVLSLIRFGMLAHGWWSGWRLSLYTAALLLLGIAACLPWLPSPLDRAAILQGLRGGRPASVPDTISPDAHTPVRV